MHVAAVATPWVRTPLSHKPVASNPAFAIARAHIASSQLLTKAEKQSFLQSLNGIEDAGATDSKLLMRLMVAISMAETEHEKDQGRSLTTADLQPLGTGPAYLSWRHPAPEEAGAEDPQPNLPIDA